MTIFHKIAFYPTLFYGQILQKIGARTWYTHIDDHCVLGSLPLVTNYKELIEKENIKAVLSMNQPFELALSPKKSDYQQLGVDYLQLPVIDYVGIPDKEQINVAVEYINRHKKEKRRVFVHCKAGRYRSAFIVACYLINNNRHLTTTHVITHIKSLRNSVILERKRQIEALNSYKSYLDKLNS